VRRSVTSGFIWKFLERFGVAGVQFVLQIILARILSPEHYGALSIMVIFTNLANVFVQSGLNTALVQNKDVDDDDFSSVFWVSLSISLALYLVIFFAAPLVAKFYNMPEIVSPLRILSLILIPGALNSVQLAKVSRELDYKKVFYSNVGAIIASGVAGIVVALLGGGLWALVIQHLVNVVTACVVMKVTVKLKLRFVCNFERIKVLFGFGSKLLVSNLIATLYQDLRSLVIGKKFDSGTLGFYNRGKQFPQFITNVLNGSVQSVMLSAMSARQSDKAAVKLMMRKSIGVSSYVIFPTMLGLAAVARPLVLLLLGEKWLPSVIYMQIYCITFAFYPVHSCNLQAINACGRSDVFLKLEIIKKIEGIILLTIAVLFFKTPVAIAVTGFISTIIASFINTYPNKKLVNYSYMEQVVDMLPAFFISVAMGALVMMVGLIGLPSAITLIIQVFLGAAFYVVMSYLLKIESFFYLYEKVKNLGINKIKRG
jgi:O-antigen/teichoic acid export membrane protein